MDIILNEKTGSATITISPKNAPDTAIIDKASRSPESRVAIDSLFSKEITLACRQLERKTQKRWRLKSTKVGVGGLEIELEQLDEPAHEDNLGKSPEDKDRG